MTEQRVGWALYYRFNKKESWWLWSLGKTKTDLIVGFDEDEPNPALQYARCRRTGRTKIVPVYAKPPEEIE